MKNILIFVTLLLMISSCWWINDANETIKKELSPSAILKKHEWFKNTSAELDKKLNDIEVYKSRITSMEEDYKGTRRKDWDRIDKEQFNQWHTELAGVKASYNSLVAEYNSAKSKINWTDFEGTPPKEYRAYIDSK